MIGLHLSFKVVALVLTLLLGHVAHASDKKKCWNAATRKDEPEILHHCRPVADVGDPHAQYLIGVVHQDGVAVPQDLFEAAKWYQLSANQGYAQAQYALGLAYYTGSGVPKNLVRAFMWMDLAASRGDKNALRTRDLIEKRLTPAEMSEARRLVREWSAKHER